MKKLLSLLSVLTISGTAVPTTIAASSYKKQENLNRNKRWTYNGYKNEINEGVTPSNGTKNGLFVCFFTPFFLKKQLILNQE